MLTRTLSAASLALAMAVAGAPQLLAQPPAAPTYNVPVTYYTLPHGLKVVLSRDTTAPPVVVAVSYQIGFSRRAEGPHGLRPPLRAHDVPGLGQPGKDGVHPPGAA